ncbi:30S ribosomal protein S8 [Candidatus Daviesbacteria bacterium]|nr:30S ribosomal protein S8 [Candidatus Daviesbacteria bacterium]
MDTVADALTRIKNGYFSHKEEVVLPYSKLVLAISKVLEKEGYLIGSKQRKGDNGHLQILVSLKYEDKKPAVSDLKRISKPGLRVYKGKDSLPSVLNGLGVAIISTPKGVMSDKQARKEGVGGEVLAYVW